MSKRIKEIVANPNGEGHEKEGFMKNTVNYNMVGVAMKSDGNYICWDKSECEWYLSKDINKAHRILGDKELNFERTRELYRKATGDNSRLYLIVKPFVYCCSDLSKSYFLEKQAEFEYVYENR